MWIKEILLGFIGLSAGCMVAGGVFALITSIGVIPRLAGKSHTAEHIRTYETAVLLGGLSGNLFYTFEFSIRLGTIFNIIFGFFAGVFVGCLYTALAESLNTTAVFSRRIKLYKGIPYVILAAGIGKMFGSLIYFFNEWSK